VNERVEARGSRIACVDAAYTEKTTVAACVLIREWRDEEPAGEFVTRLPPSPAYEPGRFFRRELVPLLRVLAEAGLEPDTVVIDGYVWLGPEEKPGLGAYLFRALGERTKVIGVAKNRFGDGRSAFHVYRGKSRKPLYVTAAGIPLPEAARAIGQMHGAHRIPAILKRVDALCRRAVNA